MSVCAPCGPASGTPGSASACSRPAATRQAAGSVMPSATGPAVSTAAVGCSRVTARARRVSAASAGACAGATSSVSVPWAAPWAGAMWRTEPAASQAFSATAVPLSSIAVALWLPSVMPVPPRLCTVAASKLPPPARARRSVTAAAGLPVTVAGPKTRLEDTPGCTGCVAASARPGAAGNAARSATVPLRRWAAGAVPAGGAASVCASVTSSTGGAVVPVTAGAVQRRPPPCSQPFRASSVPLARTRVAVFDASSATPPVAEAPRLPASAGIDNSSVSVPPASPDSGVWTKRSAVDAPAAPDAVNSEGSTRPSRGSSPAVGAPGATKSTATWDVLVTPAATTVTAIVLSASARTRKWPAVDSQAETAAALPLRRSVVPVPAVVTGVVPSSPVDSVSAPAKAAGTAAQASAHWAAGVSASVSVTLSDASPAKAPALKTSGAQAPGVTATVAGRAA